MPTAPPSSRLITICEPTPSETIIALNTYPPREWRKKGLESRASWKQSGKRATDKAEPKVPLHTQPCDVWDAWDLPKLISHHKTQAGAATQGWPKTEWNNSAFSRLPLRGAKWTQGGPASLSQARCVLHVSQPPCRHRFTSSRLIQAGHLTSPALVRTLTLRVVTFSFREDTHSMGSPRSDPTE